MQLTVASFDPERGCGLGLTDDGRPVEITAAAFAAGGLRLLRLGQRLRGEVDEAGRLRRVTLPTIHP